MSNKSLFEKLFEEVMENDEAALGIDGGDSAGDMGGAEDFGGEDMGGEEVTLTMDKATAEKLMDLLSAALGGGHDEEGESPEDEFGGSEEGAGEGEDFGGMGDEAAEDGEDEDEEDEDEEDEEGSLKESPQAQYKPFTNKGEQMTKASNRKVGGVAGTASGAGQAEKKDQTQGTAKYMPFNDKGTNLQQKGSMKVSGARAGTPSGPGKSVFHP